MRADQYNIINQILIYLANSSKKVLHLQKNLNFTLLDSLILTGLEIILIENQYHDLISLLIKSLVAIF